MSFVGFEADRERIIPFLSLSFAFSYLKPPQTSSSPSSPPRPPQSLLTVLIPPPCLPSPSLPPSPPPPSPLILPHLTSPILPLSEPLPLLSPPSSPNRRQCPSLPRCLPSVSYTYLPIHPHPVFWVTTPRIPGFSASLRELGSAPPPPPTAGQNGNPCS